MDIPVIANNRGFLQVSPEEVEEFDEGGKEEKRRHPSPLESGAKLIECSDPIDGITSNRDQTRVAVGGSRGLLKIYRVTDNSLDFVVDMRSARTRKSQLLYCPSYITWSKLNDDRMASTATTGAVAFWSVEHTKIIGHYKSHSRSATVVRWHPTKVENMISGSKDCTMLLYDVREANHVLTIRAGLTEAVRDIAFSTKVGESDIFLSADDGGSVKVWDIRNPLAAVATFRPHQGYVSSIALNPREPNLVASGGGRDKLIKVWNWNNTDRNARARPLFQVETIAPVGRVYWRPDHAWQIASCAVVNDQSLLVWDIRRPHLPVVSFSGHKDSISDIWWSKEHPHRFVSAGKDGQIRIHQFADGEKTLDHLCDAHVDVAPDGLLAVTLNCDNDLRNAPKWERPRATLQMKYDKTVRPSTRQRYAIAASRRLAMYDPFRGPIHSDLVLGIPDTAEKALKPTFFNQMAKDFLLGEMALQELCAHNAFIANLRGDERRSQIWRHVGILLSFTDFQQSYTNDLRERMEQEERKWTRYAKESNNQGLKPLLPPRAEPEMPICLLSSNKVQRWRPRRPIPNNARDPVAFLGTYIDRLVNKKIVLKAIELESEEPKCDEFFGLPSEAFSRRRAIVNSIPNMALFEPEDERWVVRPGRADWEPRKILQRTLLYLAAQGDLQMCASIASVVGRRLSETISDFQVEIWLKSYIDMLDRLELYSTIAAIFKHSWIRRLQLKTTEGTYLKERVTHIRRKKNIEQAMFEGPHKGKLVCTGMVKHGRCETCATPIIPICGLCGLSIRGQMWTCQKCHHSMHVDHSVAWFKREYEYAKDSESSEDEVEERQEIPSICEEDEEEVETDLTQDSDSDYCNDVFEINDLEMPLPKPTHRNVKILDRSNNCCPVRGCECICNVEHNDEFDVALFQRKREVYPICTATTRKVADRTEAIQAIGRNYTQLTTYDIGLPKEEAQKLDAISTGLLERNDKESRLLHNAFLASKVVNAPLRDAWSAFFDPKADSDDEEEKEIDRHYRMRVKQQIELDAWEEKQNPEPEEDDSDAALSDDDDDDDPPTPQIVTEDDEEEDCTESDDEFGGILKFEKKRRKEFVGSMQDFTRRMFGRSFTQDMFAIPKSPFKNKDSGIRVRRRIIPFLTAAEAPVRNLPPTGPIPQGLVGDLLHEKRLRHNSGRRGRGSRNASGSKYVPDYSI